MAPQTSQPFDQLIFLIRGHRVMLSTDLAQLYEVESRALVQAVKRNKERFPADFMFQLTTEEVLNLKSQTVISSWGGNRATPYAFTELTKGGQTAPRKIGFMPEGRGRRS